MPVPILVVSHPGLTALPGRTHTGTLLAFAENRMTDCGDNGKHHALVLRRSSDNGKTWGPMSTVVEGT
jgi:sialidase-1